MSDVRIRIRANRSTGELEVEGPSQAASEWWEKLWPELREGDRSSTGTRISRQLQGVESSGDNGKLPDVFGEYYSEFQSGITDVDKMLVAAVFVQGRDSERTFSTKAANQLLLDQSIKVANASQNVRQLVQTKKVFVVSGGRFRVSTVGFEHLKSLRLGH